MLYIWYWGTSSCPPPKMTLPYGRTGERQDTYNIGIAKSPSTCCIRQCRTQPSVYGDLRSGSSVSPNFEPDFGQGRALLCDRISASLLSRFKLWVPPVPSLQFSSILHYSIPGLRFSRILKPNFSQVRTLDQDRTSASLLNTFNFWVSPVPRLQFLLLLNYSTPRLWDRGEHTNANN